MATTTALMLAHPVPAQIAGASETRASVDITDPASIAAAQNLVFTIDAAVTDTITSLGVINPLSALAGQRAGVDAKVVVSGTGALSLATPAAITVTRSGGSETLTVRTIGSVSSIVGADGGPVVGALSGGMFSSPVVVTGILNGGVLSFNVTGLVTIADGLVPGNYRGVLTIVAQYN